MDMNLLDMYNADKSGQGVKPDVAGVDDIVGMEGGIDKLLGRDDNNSDTKNIDIKQEEINNTASTSDSSDSENTETEKKYSSQENIPEEKSIDNSNEKTIIDSGDNETIVSSKEKDSDNEDDLDLDNIINKVNEDNINMDLVKELEKQQILNKELEVKYGVIKSELEKIREKQAALDIQDGNGAVPQKLRGIVRIYEKYENNGDEDSKNTIIDNLAGLLTELSGKNVYSFLNEPNKSKDLANLENNNGSGLDDYSSVKKNENNLDPEALKEFGIETF